MLKNCAVPRCEMGAVARGLCRKHWEKYHCSDPLYNRPERKNDLPIRGCDRCGSKLSRRNSGKLCWVCHVKCVENAELSVTIEEYARLFGIRVSEAEVMARQYAWRGRFYRAYFQWNYRFGSAESMQRVYDHANERDGNCSLSRRWVQEYRVGLGTG